MLPCTGPAAMSLCCAPSASCSTGQCLLLVPMAMAWGLLQAEGGLLPVRTGQHALALGWWRLRLVGAGCLIELDLAHRHPIGSDAFPSGLQCRVSLIQRSTS